MNPQINREQIVDTLREALEPQSYIYAMWEAGAAAFGRVDEWSDLDLIIDVEDEQVANTFDVIESCLRSLSPIELLYEIPQPTWHGHTQKFYRLRDASPFLLVDIAIIRHSNPNKFLEPDIHGDVRVYFDKSNVTRQIPVDRIDLARKLRKRLEDLKVTFEMFQVLVDKELNRKNDVEAFSFYQSFTLRPLVEVLRMRYQPDRYNFHTRYLYYDLPPEVVEKLEGLFFVANGAELRTKHKSAQTWFYETLEQIDRRLFHEA